MLTLTRPGLVQTRQNPGAEKRKWRLGRTFSKEAICNGHLLEKGKSVSSGECHCS